MPRRCHLAQEYCLRLEETFAGCVHFLDLEALESELGHHLRRYETVHETVITRGGHTRSHGTQLGTDDD